MSEQVSTTEQQRSKLSRVAWPVVIGAALGISWWSLYTLASQRYGMPPYLAAVVSTVYDGGALVLADLSQRYARTPDSGAAPRALMLALIVSSGWLNWQHATMLHYNAAGQFLFAAPPIVGGALFEVEQRFTHRDALRRFGRVAPALPAFGRYAWLLHPARTAKRVWLITASRVDSVPVTVMDMYPTTVRVDQIEPAAPLPELLPAEVEPEQDQPAEPTDDELMMMFEPPQLSSLTVQSAVELADNRLPGAQRSNTDLADLLTRLGVRSRGGHEITATAVGQCRRRAQDRANQADQNNENVIPIHPAQSA